MPGWMRLATVKFMPAPVEVTVIPELPGDDAVIREEGDRLIIEPTQPKSLLAVLAALRPLEEEFPPIPELPVDSIEL